MKNHNRFFLSHVVLATTQEKLSFIAFITDFIVENAPTSEHYL